MKKEDIVKEINHRYLLRKMAKHPYMAPEQLPNEIISDHAKVLAEVFSELLEELTEKKRKVINIEYKDQKDIDFAKKFIELYEKMNEEN